MRVRRRERRPVWERVLALVWAAPPLVSGLEQAPLARGRPEPLARGRPEPRAQGRRLPVRGLVPRVLPEPVPPVRLALALLVQPGPARLARDWNRRSRRR